MSNHYHLVIETPDANLSRGMRQLNGIYTRRFNQRHHRVGHVFQGRYKAILVDKDSYLLELSRYVVLNPVRAGMVKAAGQWPWSSYRAMIGKVKKPKWLETDLALGQLAQRRKIARNKYIRLIAEGKDQASIWRHLSQQIYLGDAQFVAKMQARAGKLDCLIEVPKAQRKPVVQSLSYYAGRYESMQKAMTRAYKTGAYSMKAIGDYFGVHYSTVSRVVRAHEDEG